MGTVRLSCRKALSLLAQVAELVDALASGASGRKVVGVQVSPWAPTQASFRGHFFACYSSTMTCVTRPLWLVRHVTLAVGPRASVMLARTVKPFAFSRTELPRTAVVS